MNFLIPSLKRLRAQRSLKSGCLIIFKPNVSIVIPAFKAEKYLEKTLESVAHQNYEDWEILVIEDGSCDQTESICRIFQSRFQNEKLKYQRLPVCRGQGNARNQGVLNSKGKWIAFLDSDDLWPQDYLSQMLPVLEDKNADVVHCSMQYFESETEKRLGIWGPTPEDLKHFPKTLFSRNFINPSGTICRRSLFDSFQFDPSYEIQSCEDHDLWLTLVSKGKKFVYVPEVKVLYRKNHEGAATGNPERMFLADIEVMKKQWGNKSFSFGTKLQGISQNYALLGDFYLSQGNKKAWEALFKSWVYQPFKLKRFKRLIKISALFLNQALGLSKFVDTKM